MGNSNSDASTEHSQDIGNLNSDVRSVERRVASLERQLSNAGGDVSSIKDSLDASRREIDVLKQQQSANQWIQQKKVEEVLEIISSIKASLEASRRERDVLKQQQSANQRIQQKAVEELLEKISVRDKIQHDLGMKLCKMLELEKQAYSKNIDALSANISLESLKKDEEELKERLSSTSKFSYDIEMKLLKVIELEKQLSSINAEILSRKSCLDASRKDEEMLKQQLSAREMFQQDMKARLLNGLELENQLSSTKSETLFIKDDLKALKEKEEELREISSSYEKLHKDIEPKLLKVMQLEKQLSSTKTNALSAKNSLEASKNQEEGFKEQLVSLGKLQQETEKRMCEVVEHKKTFLVLIFRHYLHDLVHSEGDKRA